MTYYVDNGYGYRRAYSNIVDARKDAVLILEAVVEDKRWSAINTTSYGVPIYTSAKQKMDKATRYVNFYDWRKRIWDSSILSGIVGLVLSTYLCSRTVN